MSEGDGEVELCVTTESPVRRLFVVISTTSDSSAGIHKYTMSNLEMNFLYVSMPEWALDSILVTDADLLAAKMSLCTYLCCMHIFSIAGTYV